MIVCLRRTPADGLIPVLVCTGGAEIRALALDLYKDLPKITTRALSMVCMRLLKTMLKYAFLYLI